MSSFRRLFVAAAILLSGLAFIPYLSLSSEPFGWQLFVDVYEPEPSLDINYETGQPDSFFTLTGSDFPPDDSAAVSVNGSVLGTVPTDGDGKLGFLLDTATADEGYYIVAASVDRGASAVFLLDAGAALRTQEGSGTVFGVPSGIALTKFVYLPIVLK